MSEQTTFSFPPKGHVAILAYDSANDQWQAVYVDASGRLQVDIATAEQIEVLVHGYISGAWQKQPLQFGYSDTVVEALIDLNASAGTNTLDTTAVPAGEVHIIQTVYAVNAVTNPAIVLLSLRRNATNYGFHREASPGVGTSVENRTPVVLEEGDSIRATWTGCTLNDDLFLTITGYKFDIDL